MKHRVRVKMVEEKDFQPTLRFKTKVWVYLPSGEYFYIHEAHIGNWYQMYALYMDYPSEHAAVEEALAHILHPNVYGPAKYKALKVRERVFTPDVPSVKQALSNLRSEKRKSKLLKTNAPAKAHSRSAGQTKGRSGGPRREVRRGPVGRKATGLARGLPQDGGKRAGLPVQPRRGKVLNVPRGTFTAAQRALIRKHGTPAKFAADVYKCVPGDISLDEARQAVDKYNREWSAAG